jgi:DNA-binding HxlR family transcriptional regulator
MAENIRFLFKKGMIDIIFYLSKTETANYYTIQKQGFVGSRQTFANRLKELERRGIINREVKASRPPRVEYSLTNK